MSSIRVNGDGTVDWCGLTGGDLAAVFRAYATGGVQRFRAVDERTMDLAYQALGGCMAVWEAGP